MPSARPYRGTILVVDDSPVVLDLLAEALSDAGFRVLGCRSWVDGNVLLREERPDLVLMDVSMPALDGGDLCRILKASPKYADLPVVLFSSLGSDELRRQASASGADGWIHKRSDHAGIRREVEREFDRLVRREGEGGRKRGPSGVARP